MDGGCQSPWALTIAHSSPTNLHTTSTEVFYKSHFKLHSYLYILAYFTHIFLMTNSKTEWQSSTKQGNMDHDQKSKSKICLKVVIINSDRKRIGSKNLLIKSSDFFFTCILPDYVGHESLKEFWKNRHFENMRADFLRRCQNLLQQTCPEMMHLQP